MMDDAVCRLHPGNFTLPETNIALENKPSQKGRNPKGNCIFQPSIFRGKLAVSFRVRFFHFAPKVMEVWFR